MLCSVKERRRRSSDWEKYSVSMSHDTQHGRKATECFRPCGVRGAKSQKRGRVGGAGRHKDTAPGTPGPRHGLRMSEATAGRVTGRDTEATDTCRTRGLSGTEQDTKVCEDEDRDVAA